jgi:hypothetical protein
MRKSVWIIFTALFLAIVAPNAFADTVTDGSINFTYTSCIFCTYAGGATGSFVYDNTTNTFTSFTVAWDSLLFDFTSLGNTFANPSASGCAALPTGNAFIEDLVCGSSWLGYSNQDGSGAFQLYFADGTTPYVPLAATNYEIDRGYYSVALTPDPTPEPASYLLFGTGLLALSLFAARSRRYAPPTPC